ncbi:M10 family metallopeptidase C-terminal domain-containing protein [Yoonia maritima]|uniref:M10 family metallopeptidase C-terminal domain-containing protein n=1 Tax=Yoonia maritima TaxID=1435347 RepID=UPI00373621BB
MPQITTNSVNSTTSDLALSAYRILDLASGPVGTLDSGTQRADTDEPITVYFVPDGSRRDNVTSEGWTAYEREQFMAALASISAVANVTFVETSNQYADFQVVKDEDELYAESGDTLLGYFYYPFYDYSSEGVFNGRGLGWDTNGLQPGGLGYSTIIHEALHGLGLAHPHDGDSILPGLDPSDRDYPFYYYGDYGLNQSVYTVMSYNSGYNGSPSNSYDYGEAMGPMALDIAALQALYGANTTHASGNDNYELPGSNSANSGTGWLAIWDTGGEDTISYSGTSAVTIDLRPATLQYEVGGGGFISAADGIAGGYTIANGVIIENATGGSGNDNLIGNDVANTLTGNNGSDDLSGKDGDDVLNGGNGRDNLFGGAGNDELNGGNGNDTARGGIGADQINGGANDDTLHGDSGSDTIEATAGTNNLYGGSGYDTLTGGSGVDTIFGGSGNDVILGGGGNDQLHGGRGDDSINGGNGDDAISGDMGQDTLTGGAGADTFIFTSASDSWATSADTINDFEVGIDAIDLSGINADLSATDALVLSDDGVDTRIEIDRDLDGTAEMVILVIGTTGLTTGDFIL